MAFFSKEGGEEKEVVFTKDKNLKGLDIEFNQGWGRKGRGKRER